jgi:hypothetical protein
MRTAQYERNAAVIREKKSGKTYAEVAKEFGISRDRARQIVELARGAEKRRAELVGTYGSDPNVHTLPDDTPIEVLELCDGDMHGWAARIGHLKYWTDHPIRTLGELRRTSDAQLRKIPNLGKKMIAELRRFCPVHDEQHARAAMEEALQHVNRALHAIERLEGSESTDARSVKAAREDLEAARALLGRSTQRPRDCAEGMRSAAAPRKGYRCAGLGRC